VSSQILPILLLTVGTCGAIHILAMVYRGLSEGRPMEEAISFALGHSGLAVLMASITTAAGLVSFSSARLAQVANLGTIAPVGVLLAFVYVVSLLPALLSFAPLRATRFGAGRDRIHRRISGVLARMGGLASARPRAVVAVSGMLLAVAAIGISRVHYSQYPMRWFPEGDVLRSDTEFIDAHLGGVDSLEIVVDTQERNGLHDPRFLEHLETAIGRSRLLANDAPINKSISILEVVKETHRALNENRESFYAVPDDRRLLAQELLLFENSGSDDLEEWTDSQFRTARVSLRLPAGDAMRYPPFIAALERVFREQLGDGFDVEVTGLGALFGRTFAAVNPTMGRSYTIALLIITPLMVLLIGNLRGGLVAMIPNLIPVFLTLGLMGALGIPLDNSSLLVGCIIIGLAVDDTIHFMHKFQRYFRETGNAADAVRRTLETTGSALLFTSLCLGAGFTTMLLAYMVNIVEFGMLALFATVVAFLADVVLAPALMVLVTRRAGASSPR
jgi:predicted RND superfamily exporter protein